MVEQGEILQRVAAIKGEAPAAARTFSIRSRGGNADLPGQQCPHTTASSQATARLYRKGQEAAAQSRQPVGFRAAGAGCPTSACKTVFRAANRIARLAGTPQRGATQAVANSGLGFAARPWETTSPNSNELRGQTSGTEGTRQIDDSISHQGWRKVRRKRNLLAQGCTVLHGGPVHCCANVTLRSPLAIPG